MVDSAQFENVIDRQVVERHSEMSLDDLYIELFAIYQDDREVLAGPEIQLARGRQLFEKHRDTLIQAVCQKWNACEQIKKFDDKIDLISAIAGVIAAALSIYAVSLLSIVLAAILIKIGLKALCGCT